MPMAAPTMPSSLIGVTKHRLLPKRCCSPAVQRNTPPKYPTSSPNTTTLSSLSIITAIASRMASIIVLRGMLVARFLALAAQMRRHLGVDALEHVPRGRLRPGMERSVRLGLLLGGDYLVQDLRLALLVALLRPDATPGQMIFQPKDRIPEWPSIGFTFRAIGRRVVRGRVRSGAVGHVLNERRPKVAPGALDGPFCDRMHGQIIVAVYPERRDAKAVAARRERGRRAPGEPLKRRDSPLIVNDVEDDWRLVGRGEDKGRVEIGLRRRAVADPSGRDPGVVLDGRGHRPADRLDELRREIAGDREKAVFARGIHDGELTPVQRIALVGIDLVHHLDDRIAASDQKPGLPIRRKVHVAGLERAAEGAAHRLLA